MSFSPTHFFCVCWSILSPTLLDTLPINSFSCKEAIGDLKKTSQRLDVLKTRKRSAADLEDRFATGCKFFARGRCTKGNSCRFLHTKQPVTSHETSKIPHDKGLEEKSLLDGSSQSGENLRMRGGEDSLHPNSHLGYTSKSPAFPSSITGYSWKNHLSQDTRIYQSDVGDGSFPVLINHMQANADPASTGSNKVQISGHSDMLPEKDLPRHGTTVAHQENMNTSSKEDKHLESEIDVDNKSVNTKSVVLKNFHVALVEFVKELLRPT
uniref:C3H1-type domain-containing protein n=1 Tax=Solanum lycopersicum TaxID=4081 RepID=K4DES0_SOLLC